MARIGLTSAAISVLVAMGTALAATPGPLPPSADQALARAIFKELVEIRTTHDAGSMAAAKAIAQRLLAGGFAAVQHEVIHLDSKALPVEAKIAEVGAPAGGFLHHCQHVRAHPLAKPAAARHHHAG